MLEIEILNFWQWGSCERRWMALTRKDRPCPGVIINNIILRLPQRCWLDCAPNNQARNWLRNLSNVEKILPQKVSTTILILRHFKALISTYQIFLVHPHLVKSVHLFFTSVSKNLQNNNSFFTLFLVFWWYLRMFNINDMIHIILYINILFKGWYLI